MRFHLTNEFSNFTVENWTTNSDWFRIKLLVGDATRRGSFQNTDEMSNCTYAGAIRKVLDKLCIPSKHFVHIGRGMGPKILELNETEREEIRILGNWDPKIQETTYSSKLPMKAIRSIAGFVMAGGMYFNPRTTVEVSDELIAMTPFAFCLDALEAISAVIAQGTKKYTAYCFLRAMKELAAVLVQDAAVLAVLHKDRMEHPIFQLEVFKSEQFTVSCCFGTFMPITRTNDHDATFFVRHLWILCVVAWNQQATTLWITR